MALYTNVNAWDPNAKSKTYLNPQYNYTKE